MPKRNRPRRVPSLEVRQRRMGYVFTAPLMVGMLAFVVFPVLQSLLFSFSRLSVVASGYRLDFLGLENYRYIFAVDPEYRTMVLTALRDMLVNVPVVVLFSFFVASLLNQKFRGRSAVRAILFLPVIIASGVVQSVDRGDQFSSLIAAGTQAGTEAVVPLENNTGWMDVMAQKLGDRMGGTGGGSITVPVYIGGEKLAETVVNALNAQTRCTGVNPLYI